RRRFAYLAYDNDAEPVRAWSNPAVRADDLMATADIEVVHQEAILDVKAVARGGVAMRDQNAFGAGHADFDMGLDGVAAAAHVGGDVGRHVTHAGMEDKIVSRALAAR